MAYENELRIAMTMADAADKITLRSFRDYGQLEVEIKADSSPVSEVDREVEYELRRIVYEADSHGVFLGEESSHRTDAPTSRRVAQRRWIVDPLDQTRNYLRGIEIFGTLIAFEERGKVQMGLISAPMLRCRWWAIRGQGAYQNGLPIRVSSAQMLEASAGSLHPPNLLSAGFVPSLGGRLAHVEMLRGLGNFWAHMLVARGALDWAISIGGKIWDYAAPSIIVTEAGGTFTDFSGQARLDGGEALSSNGRLHMSLTRLLHS